MASKTRKMYAVVSQLLGKKGHLFYKQNQYFRMFIREHAVTYFSAASVFTGCSDLDFVAIVLWRE